MLNPTAPPGKGLLFDRIFIIKFALCDSIIFPNEIFDILGIFLYKFTNLNQWSYPKKSSSAPSPTWTTFNLQLNHLEEVDILL